ncbi:hypothetical protein [Saccharothrix longispora]|uniref:hypothetical protein n=1 Tax=Saccharothrix longispora TaxID=33920 RepID=UPI0028FD7DF9|nr:hypothetical protein [Saccharothrix longispora]MDU0291660.1 hypothetical protein [Saccharothrix longispora]
MLKRLVSGAALAALTGALVFGGSTAAQATTTPDASCVNSDPLGLVNVVTCSINVDVDVLPDSVITFGDILSNNKVLNGAELDLLEVTIENVLKDVDVEDNLVFKGIIVDAVDDLDLIDDIDVSKVIVDLL